MGCGPSKSINSKDYAVQSQSKPRHDILVSLASQTPFSVNEVESLYDLFTKLSTTLVKDGFIHKEELQLALFRSHKQKNLFLDKMFDLFDVDGNGLIEFGEFVRSLSIFHPKTSDTVKASCAFKLYDLRQTGYIEKEELKEMLVALLNESDLSLSDEVVESMVEKTFTEADAKGDGQIDEEEWKEYVKRYPTLLKNMTLPYLMDVNIAFPSFVLKTEAEEPKM